MGKVYVLRKNEDASAGMVPNMAVGPQGMSLVMGMSPEKVNYAQYGTGVDDKGRPYGGSAGQEKWARRFGNVGSKARLGLGALSGINSLYNATSSGQPGALSAFGQGAMGGYYGSQGLEQWAADRGAEHGAWRERRDAAAEEKRNTVAGVTPSARQEAMSMMPSGPMNLGATPPPAPGYQLPVAGVGGVTPQAQSQAMSMMPNAALNLGATPPPAAGFKPGYPSAEDSSTGQAFAQAAPDPKKVGVSTTQSKITDYPPTHPLVTSLKEFEQETEGGGSTTQGG